jgi:hypothetical protein
MELDTMKGGDVTNANTMKFIHVNVHPWFVMNLYLNFSLISVHSYLAFS